jgi:prevent-host-death family protein
MFNMQGIEAVASISELRANSTNLVERAKEFQGIMIQKNNEPVAVLLSYDRYIELSEKSSAKTRR